MTSGYLQLDLAADQAGAALLRDPNLIDPWGIAVSPSGGGFWISDHGSDSATVYSGDVSGTPFARNPLVVNVAGGAPTGQTANGTTEFSVSQGAASGPAAFLMAGGGGTISGWNQYVPLPAPSLQSQVGVSNPSAGYTGLTVGFDGTQYLLYAANFVQGAIDVFDGSFAPAATQGGFADAAIPAGYAPYNIANLGGRLYVSYAKQNSGQLNPASGNGGYVAVFDYNGNLQQNLISNGSLDAPWGLALAPANFGDYSGDLLVGNWGDGTIHAFNAYTGALLGAMTAPGGGEIAIAGLRALSFGNGLTAGDYNTLYFTAGLDGGQHGLFGALESAQSAQLSAAGVSGVAYVNETYEGVVATFVDANAGRSPGSYVADINWGDGASSPATVTALGGGRFNLSGSHVYTQTGLHNITATIEDPSLHVAYASGAADVRTPALTATAASIGATEDSAYSGAVATFSDADGNASAGAYRTWIDWGDGATSKGTVAADGFGGFSVSGTHTYDREFAGNVLVLIDDSDGDEVTATAAATVADADTLTATALAASAVAGSPLDGPLATFTDVNLHAVPGDFSATIDWGDGATTSGAIAGSNGSFTVTGSHAYASSGSYDVKITVAEPAPGTASASATLTASVTPAPIHATGETFAAVEGQTFSGAVASFTDDNPNLAAGDFTATIDWGDGTVGAGSIAAGQGEFQVRGVHVYAWRSAGVAVLATIHGPSGVTATADALGDVADAPLAATAAIIAGYENTPLSDVTVATFVDTGTPQNASAYSASVDWGDGTTSAGTVSAQNGGFAVTGTHVYASEGKFQVAVVAAETGGTPVTVHETATILAALLWNGTRGTPTDRWINEAYGDLLGRLADPGALSYWNERLEQGANRNAVVSAIEASGEYRAREVQSLFRLYLRRNVDPGAQNYFSAQLAAGATVESLAAVLLGSQEYLQNFGGGTNDGFLGALYQDALGRPIDPGAEIYFSRQLSAGASRGQIAAIILNSDEYRVRWVGGLYQQFLDHSTTSGSIDFWLGYMRQGGRDEQVIAAIVGSDEYFERSAP